MKDYYISVDQDRYSTSIVAKYLDTATVKASRNNFKTILPSNIIFTKANVHINDENVENLTREFKIHYGSCIGSFISLLSTRVNLSFSVQKL